MKIKNCTVENIDEIIRQARQCIYVIYAAKHECNVLKHSKYLKRYNELEQIVINSNNAFCAYKFAREVQSSDVQALERVVINSNQPYLCKAFAINIRKANILNLQDAVINSGDSEAIYSFALDVKGANVDLLGNALKANKCDCLYIKLMECIKSNEK